jgi:hypothetical protein
MTKTKQNVVISDIKKTTSYLSSNVFSMYVTVGFLFNAREYKQDNSVYIFVSKRLGIFYNKLGQ